MTFTLPVIIYLALIFFSLGISFTEHGKLREGRTNAITSLISTIIHMGLIYWIVLSQLTI